MHPLEKKTLEIIRQESLLHPGEKVLTAVSAGPDSMALLHILARLAPVLDFTLAAAYVNHGLRTGEAQVEEALVKKTAQTLHIEFFAAPFNVKGYAADHKISIEHAARELRYNFLVRTAREIKAQKIALAHTADDQAEEVLLRLIRGTARKGLSGMKSLRADKFIRPFLPIQKTLLLDYLEKYHIPFQTDSSNRENIYLRNRIRNELLPFLAAHYNPDIRRTLIRTARILQDEEELLEEITHDAFKDSVSIPAQKETENFINSDRQVAQQPEEIRIILEKFFLHPRAVQRRVLEKCFWHMGCNARSRQIENLLQLALSCTTGGRMHLADGLRASVEKEQIIFQYPQGRGKYRGQLVSASEVSVPETNIPGPGSYDFPPLNKRLVLELLDKSIPRTNRRPLSSVRCAGK